MAAQRNCFSLPGERTVRRYTDGTWVRRPAEAARPYRIKASLWAAAGTSITRSTPQHYGCAQPHTAQPHALP